MNDIFMRNVLKEATCTEYILQVIMNRKNLKVIDQTLQKDYKNLQGRSAQMETSRRNASTPQTLTPQESTTFWRFPTLTNCGFRQPEKRNTAISQMRLRSVFKMRISILNAATTEQMGYGSISFFVCTKSTNLYFSGGINEFL